MASQKPSLRIPPALAETIEDRWKKLGYQSFNSYAVGLFRYDLMVQGDHYLTLPIAQSRPEERDQVDDEIVKANEEGKPLRGEFLGRLLKDIAAGKFSSPEEIAEEIARVIAKGSKKEGGQ